MVTDLKKPWDMEPLAKKRMLNMWQVKDTPNLPSDIRARLFCGQASIMIIVICAVFAVGFFMGGMMLIALIAVLIGIFVTILARRIILSIVEIVKYQMREPFLAYNSIFEVTCCYLNDQGFDVWIPHW